jgi:hypothetical protein
MYEIFSNHKNVKNLLLPQRKIVYFLRLIYVPWDGNPVSRFTFPDHSFSTWGWGGSARRVTPSPPLTPHTWGSSPEPILFFKLNGRLDGNKFERKI